MTNNFNDSELYQYPPFNQHCPDPIWNRDSEYIVPVISSVGNGPKGDKGDPLNFDDLTDEQLGKIYKAIGYRKLDGVYTVTDVPVREIPIPVTDGYQPYDVLFVDVNGLDLVEGVDYFINGDNIILASDDVITHVGTRVHFRTLRFNWTENEFVKSARAYSTVENMVQDENLEAGAICHTNGFHSSGDGGAAWYLISSTASENGTDVIELENGLCAVLQPKEYITPEQLGVVNYSDISSWEGSSRTYDKSTIVEYDNNIYVARVGVPQGVSINNRNYWVKCISVDKLSDKVSDLSTETSTEIATAVAAETQARKLDIEKAHVFETVADMKANTNLSVGAICHTNGFHTSGDGGAAWYVISEIGTANEMDVIACGDLFANLIIEEKINVLAYGAQTSDAEHISYEIANKNSEVFNYVFNLQKHVYIPNGIYYISDTITISNDNFHLEGADIIKTEFRSFNMSNKYMLHITPTYSNFIIENLSFYNTLGDNGCIKVEHCYDACVIRNLYIVDFIKSSLCIGDETLENLSQTLLIDNVLIASKRETTITEPLAIFFNCFEMNITNSKFLYRTKSDLPCIELHRCWDTNITGCSFLRTTCAAIKFLQSARYFRIHGNTFERVAASNIQEEPQTENAFISFGNSTETDEQRIYAHGYILASNYYNSSKFVKCYTTQCQYITVIDGILTGGSRNISMSNELSVNGDLSNLPSRTEDNAYFGGDNKTFVCGSFMNQITSNKDSGNKYIFSDNSNSENDYGLTFNKKVGNNLNTEIFNIYRPYQINFSQPGTTIQMQDSSGNKYNLRIVNGELTVTPV